MLKKLYAQFKLRDFHPITEGMVGMDCQLAIDAGYIKRGSGQVLILLDREALFEAAYGSVNVANKWFR